MKKIILIAVFFSFSVWAGASDNINLNSEVMPVCEVSFDPEPIASNLDMTSSQSHLHIARFTIATNTGDLSSPWRTDLNFDWSDTLVNQSNSVYTFSLSGLDGMNQDGGADPGLPFGVWGFPGANSGWEDLYISYTGVPALSLVQGVYRATWYVSCSIEPRI